MALWMISRCRRGPLGHSTLHGDKELRHRCDSLSNPKACIDRMFGSLDQIRLFSLGLISNHPGACVERVLSVFDECVLRDVCPWPVRRSLRHQEYVTTKYPYLSVIPSAFFFSSIAFYLSSMQARAPFRFPRLVIFGALLAGASGGLLIIISRLIAALKGGEGAPDLNESLTNFGVNLTAVTIFALLVRNDLKNKTVAEEKLTREEALGNLEVTIGTRTVLLQSLRLSVRPVIIFGTQVSIRSATVPGQSKIAASFSGCP